MLDQRRNSVKKIKKIQSRNFKDFELIKVFKLNV